MDQQVSPAVVVVVMILIVAIGVGLYFLVVEGRPGGGDADDAGVGEMVPPDDATAAGEPDGASAVVEDPDEGEGQDAETDADDASDAGDDGDADEPADTEVPPEG